MCASGGENVIGGTESKCQLGASDLIEVGMEGRLQKLHSLLFPYMPSGASTTWTEMSRSCALRATESPALTWPVTFSTGVAVVVC